jgi:hypothetical protein
MGLMSLDKSAPALAYFIAACVVIAGVIELVAGVQLKHAIPSEWPMIDCAALTILLSILLFVVPGAGTQGLVWVIGLFAIALGILLIIVALRIRGLQPEIEAAMQTYMHILEEKHRMKSSFLKEQELVRERNSGSEN